jgi:hypothetical protein
VGELRCGSRVSPMGKCGLHATSESKYEKCSHRNSSDKSNRALEHMYEVLPGDGFMLLVK